MSRGLELVQIFLPQGFLIHSQHVQRIPGVDSGVVVIIKVQLDCVVAYLLNAINVDVLFADLQFFLPGTVALDFCRRGIHPQVFGW